MPPPNQLQRRLTRSRQLHVIYAIMRALMLLYYYWYMMSTTLVKTFELEEKKKSKGVLRIQMLNMLIRESDDDIGNETEDESESLNFASGSRKRKDPPYVRSEKRSRIRSKKSEDVVNLASSFHSASDKIGKAFEDMNSNLVAIAQVWSSEEERNKKLEEDNNKILEEVLKLDLSASDTLEVATILAAKEHKLRIFYQAPTTLKKQYVTDLLRKK